LHKPRAFSALPAGRVWQKVAQPQTEAPLFTALAPDTIPRPLAPYSHGMVVPEGMKLVLCSGQLGLALDGTIPPDCEGQARLCFAAIEAILAEAGLGFDHVVKLTAYVSGREHLRPYMDVRNSIFSPPYPASTLMIVSGFARPEFVVEVEALAAGPA
jgi:enamine deaminase RidA (YjgF/YER057c/UK114 family)